MPHAPSHDEKILVTGGAGFIGRHLLEALCALGHRPVALARKIEKVESLSTNVRDGARWAELDITDADALRDFIRAESPSVIFHLAGTRGKGGNARNDCAELNFRATANLLEAAKGARRLILIGSAEEYGDHFGPLTESLPLEPVSDYGKSKAEATRLALKMFETEACPAVILRPFTVYGPHQPPQMFVASATRCAVNGLPFEMSGGTQRRDLVYIDDVVRALLAAASVPGLEGKVINIGSGWAEGLREIARLIWQISESRAPLHAGARPASTNEMQETWADIALARKLLDWEPRISLEDGLRATIEWQRERKRSDTEEQKEISNLKSEIKK